MGQLDRLSLQPRWLGYGLFYNIAPTPPLDSMRRASLGFEVVWPQLSQKWLQQSNVAAIAKSFDVVWEIRHSCHT